MRRRWISVDIFGPVQREIQSWPSEVKKELGAVLTLLQKGESIGLPDVRPVPSIAKGVSEIRISLKPGEYRVFYLIAMEVGILVFHSFKKKTQATPHNEIETARKRLRAHLEELGL